MGLPKDLRPMENLGFAVSGIFILAWIGAYAAWKFRRLDQVDVNGA